MPDEVKYKFIHAKYLGDVLKHAEDAANEEGWRLVSTMFIPGPVWNEYVVTLERVLV